MEPSPPGQYDPLPLVLIVLSAVTGLVDAVSVLGLGQVFVANMTGNTVFLGFAIGGAPGFDVARNLTALIAFFVGAWAGGLIAVRHATASRRRCLLTVATGEALLFWISAFLAIGFDTDALAPTRILYLLIILTAIAMGLRNATVRALKVPDLTTTVLTLTITGLAADSSLAGGSNRNWQRRVAAVLALLIGAVLGAALLRWSGLTSTLVLTGAIVLGVTIAYAFHPASRQTAGDAA
ncbi:YoaK family protein [Sinorhizobium terangae]|uniref:YoaK family protein n=1 Tax=Sinorhizobium terangae TaxID=110322 RepID=UPI0024B199A1|nr:YoaK family protein [Sinorhizobium terangae]WFU49933.1 YoaK family protein [Sinorhizobium terangae]